MYQPLQGDEPGLVGYYRFNEPSGATVIDSSPAGNDGTLAVSGDWVESDAPLCGPR